MENEKAIEVEARDAALVKLCGLDTAEDLSGTEIMFSRTVAHGMFTAGVLFAQGQWVSVEERLPDENLEWYLCTFDAPDYGGWQVSEFQFRDGKWHIPGESLMPYPGRIIAWQPLPAPYQPAENYMKDDKTLKATILKVGTFDEDGRPMDWSFGVPPGGVGMYYEDWTKLPTLIGGYTLQELREIADKAAEA